MYKKQLSTNNNQTNRSELVNSEHHNEFNYIVNKIALSLLNRMYKVSPEKDLLLSEEEYSFNAKIEQAYKNISNVDFPKESAPKKPLLLLSEPGYGKNKAIEKALEKVSSELNLNFSKEAKRLQQNDSYILNVDLSNSDTMKMHYLRNLLKDRVLKEGDAGTGFIVFDNYAHAAPNIQNLALDIMQNIDKEKFSLKNTQIILSSTVSPELHERMKKSLTFQKIFEIVDFEPLKTGIDMKTKQQLVEKLSINSDKIESSLKNNNKI